MERPRVLIVLDEQMSIKGISTLQKLSNLLCGAATPFGRHVYHDVVLSKVSRFAFQQSGALKRSRRSINSRMSNSFLTDFQFKVCRNPSYLRCGLICYF
jgi:hypothetical protein